MKLKRVISSLLIISLLCVLFSCTKETNKKLDASALKNKWNISTNANDNKMIIDIDTMYMNDDAYALLIAAQAHKMGFIDLLGFVTSSCNVFSAVSAYEAYYMLNEIGIIDIPVYQGDSIPRNGWVDIEKVKKESGISAWYGCYAYLDSFTEDPNKVYDLNLSAAPKKLENCDIKDNAIDFIIEQVHKYKNQVTLVTLASLTNIAKAIEKDPTIVDDAAGIILMGGDFEARVDKLEDYEINFWFDPEATNMVLKQPWKNKIIVSSDSAETCKKGKDIYEKFKSKNTGIVSASVVNFLSETYENNKVEKLLVCWDPITIVYYLCPDVITKIEPRGICVDEREGLTYGLTRDWEEGREPEGIPVYDIIFECDREKFWDFVSDIFSI